jgi:single-strand DNA-binding protein
MNVITIAGTLGKDPELKQVGQDNVLTFSVADSQGREKPTIWWNCQLWGKRATSMQQYLSKGSKVTVTGQVTEREYTTKEGEKRKVMDVRVNDLALQGDRGQQAAPAPAKPAKGGATGFDDFVDSIPF